LDELERRAGRKLFEVVASLVGLILGVPGRMLVATKEVRGYGRTEN
jgi:hypothetical protein